MTILGVILARAGSKGLRNKCVLTVHGRPMIDYTLDHAALSQRLTATVLTTDSEPAAERARARKVETIARPPELATDNATIDAACRHAVSVWEERHAARVHAIVILYANIPVRADGIIDRCVERLLASGATSVRTVAPIGKHHPDWLHKLDGDRMQQFRANSVYRRQDLEPLFYHDGAVIAVTRAALFDPASESDAQAFLGQDRRAVVQDCGDAVDIDTAADLAVAEVILSRGKDSPDAQVNLAANRLRDGALTPAEARADLARASIDAVRIGGRDIGQRRSTYVIAEAGVNHNGRLDTALRLVDAAVAAGADAVKFQVFRADELAIGDAPMAEYQRRACGNDSQRSMLKRLELSDREFERVRDHCIAQCVEFLATPFGVADVERLTRLGVRAIKVASTDLTNVPLLRHACATGLPLIVSTGAATAEEITSAVRRLCEWRAASRLILLHCVSRYPAPLSASNLNSIASMMRAYGIPVGFSDHSLSESIGALAVAAGACVLEKHLTLDRSDIGPDHAMSLDATQFRTYVNHVRDADAALGDGVIGMTELEADVRRVARKSVVLAQPIRAGTVLTAEMLTIKRPAGGIEPACFDDVIGRRVAIDAAADTLLSWEMLSEPAGVSQ